MLLPELKARLEEMGLTPKKALGQNFLINPRVIHSIIDACLETKATDYLEIGPGLGALTEELIKRGLRPRLIELDRELVAYWRKRGLEVIEQDALRFDWQGLKLQAPALLVSNLPYQIASHLIVDRCFGPAAIQYMVLMMQKEVAQRLTATPSSKEYGFLSVLVQLHFRLRRVTDAGPGDFHPPPKVVSRVLAFERLPDPGLGMPFLKFVKAAFSFRRKFMLKNIRGKLDKAKQQRLDEVWEEMGFSPKLRAEELSPQQFAELFRKIYGN